MEFNHLYSRCYLLFNKQFFLLLVVFGGWAGVFFFLIFNYLLLPYKYPSLLMALQPHYSEYSGTSLLVSHFIDMSLTSWTFAKV